MRGGLDDGRWSEGGEFTSQPQVLAEPTTGIGAWRFRIVWGQSSLGGGEVTGGPAGQVGDLLEPHDSARHRLGRQALLPDRLDGGEGLAFQTSGG